MSVFLDVFQIAHDIGMPHQEPAPSGGGGGGASTILILVGVVISLLVVAGLVWVKKRSEE